MMWHNKPYYSLDAWCKNTLGEKCYKISLDAGMTCPNRDGTLGTRGCIFCSQGGSGEFAVKLNPSNISSQLSNGIEQLRQKYPAQRFIAYFQAYTNTYAPVERLRTFYQAALAHPDVCGISIGTRPDCLDAPVLNLLSELRLAWPDKFIWVELGLQTIHDKTAGFIRRGYPLSCFEDAFSRLSAINIPVIVHIILGLPREDSNLLSQTISYLNRQKPFGIKLQLLHILKHTDLADYYSHSPFPVYTMEEYLDELIRCLEQLSPDIVIHRLTGDGPKDLLLAPLWSTQKHRILNTLHSIMKQRNTYQGRCYHDTRPTDSL